MLMEKGLSKNELDLARQHKIQIGMSACGLYASWGKPTKQNISNYSWGQNIQNVYGSYKSSNIDYVYTKNGVISSTQLSR